MRIRILLPLVVALALAAPARGSMCTPTTSAAEVDTGPTPAGQVYVDTLPFCCDTGPDLWIYEESNGISGLQRDDPHHDDTCRGVIHGDTIIF